MATNYKATTLDAAGKLFDESNATAAKATALKRYAIGVAILLGTSNAGLREWRNVSQGYATPIRATLKSLGFEGAEGLVELHKLGPDEFGARVTETVAESSAKGAKGATSGKGPKGSESVEGAKGSKGDESSPVPAPTLTFGQWLDMLPSMIGPELDMATRVNRVEAIRDAIKRAERTAKSVKVEEVAA